MSSDKHVHMITLLPSGIKQLSPSGTLLTDALLEMGIALKTPCGGKGTCGKCRVSIEGTSQEVLACQTNITRNITVHAQPKDIDQDICIPALRPDSRISAAMDIGTTSVRISLVDLSQRDSFEIASFLNPQQRFGHDVISRIAAAGDPANLLVMQNLIRKAINIRLGSVLHTAKIPTEKVEQVVFSGNTTMLYLLFGIDVQPLGRFPYTTRTMDFMGLSARDIGLDCIGSTPAIALPVLSAFIGADLMGGLALCHDLGITRNTFFIDLGTNGELFLLDGKGNAFATSCAMGPALEGMNITWGMTADTGAITHIYKRKEGLGYHMIGSGEPAGITGTALVDMIALLLDNGIIAPNGTFTNNLVNYNLLHPIYLNQNGESRELRFWGDGRLTQKDIRNIQLAKAASLTATRFLLEASGCDEDDIKHVLIAGSFGENLDLKHFSRLGFISRFPNAKFEFLGNTSLKAAEKACMESDFLQHAATLRDKTREIVLSKLPRFQDVFMQSLEFPLSVHSYADN
jgi:uncharacterized 2Fe-2S/4Fe-4S cluster protein (DUF4445 family)